MKNIIRICSLMLIFMLIASFLVSCGKAGGSNSGVKNNGGKTGLVPIGNLSEYKIVRSDSSDDTVKEIVKDLRETIKNKFGVELGLGTDYSPSNGKEILIGETKRSESKAASKDVLSDNAYVIRQSGNKIVICGGSNEALSAAIEKWTSKMVDPKGRLCIPITENGYIFEPEGMKIDKLTLNGEKMQGMSIYAKDPILGIYAKQIKALFSEYADVELEIVSNKIPKKGIILTFDSENYRNESISVEDGAIKITPAYANPKFAYEKLKEILDSAKDKSVDITEAVNYSGEIDFGEIYTKEELMELLQKVYDSDSVIVGELADNGTNKNSTLISSGLEYFREQTGEYPGLMSIDVASSFTYIKEGGDDMLHIAEELIGYAAKGGVIVTHAHTSCPTEPHTYRQGTMNYSQWNEVFTEGSELNKAYYEILDLTADFFEILDKENVPVIWRPYHENNGNWFWYGAGRKDGIGGTRLEADYYKKLWITTYEYYTEVRGLDNLIWVYNPGIGDERDDLAAPLYCYPGDEYVDIVGIDWYSNGDYFEIENTSTYKDLASTGKIVNMCEFGLSGDALVEPSLGEKGEQKDLFSCRDALTYLSGMNKSGYKTAYWLFWQGNSSITGMGYGDEFMQSELTLGLNETRALLEEIMK